MYTNEILRPIIYKKMHGNSAGNGKQRGEKNSTTNQLNYY